MTMTDEVAAPASAGASPAAAPEPTEAEVKAKELGWTPKSEFKGNPESWTDAEEYIKRGDPRYLRERLGQTEKTVKQLRDEMKREREEQETAFKSRLENMDRVNQRLLKSQRDAIYAEIEAKKLQAVEDGDTDRYRKLHTQEQATREKHAKEDEDFVIDKPAAKAKPGDKIEGHDDAIAEWWADNPEIWFNESKAKYASLLYGQAEKKFPTVAERLRFVEDGLKRAAGGNGASGDKAETEPSMPSVEGGARLASTSRKKGWNEIPDEERKIYDRHIKEKLYKDRAEAASVHWGE